MTSESKGEYYEIETESINTEAKVRVSHFSTCFSS